MLSGMCLRGAPRSYPPGRGLIPAAAVRQGMDNGTRGAYADAAVDSGSTALFLSLTYKVGGDRRTS